MLRVQIVARNQKYFHDLLHFGTTKVSSYIFTACMFFHISIFTINYVDVEFNYLSRAIQTESYQFHFSISSIIGNK